MMKKSIDVYLFGELIFMNAKKKTTMGLDIFALPVSKLPLSESFEVVGEKMKETLSQYLINQQHPSKEEWKTFSKPLIDLANCKTAKAFFEKVKYVPVSLENNCLTFYPTINKGMKEGFKNTEQPNIELDYNSANNEDLAKCLLKAFDLSSIEI
jgi:hypothetical protein